MHSNNIFSFDVVLFLFVSDKPSEHMRMMAFRQFMENFQPRSKGDILIGWSQTEISSSRAISA